MQCPSCGADIDPGMHFCHKCGAFCPHEPEDTDDQALHIIARDENITYALKNMEDDITISVDGLVFLWQCWGWWS